MALDKKDLQILDELCANSKVTTHKLSKKLNIPITTVHNRIKKLEHLGVIKGYTVKVDHSKLGRPMLAYILISVMYMLPNGKKIEQEELARKIKKFPEAEDVIITAGVTDIMVKARTASVEELNGFIIKKLRSVDGVDKTQTMIVLSQA